MVVMMVVGAGDAAVTTVVAVPPLASRCHASTTSARTALVVCYNLVQPLLMLMMAMLVLVMLMMAILGTLGCAS